MLELEPLGENVKKKISEKNSKKKILENFRKKKSKIFEKKTSEKNAVFILETWCS